jgi:hypothetical protein
MLIALHYKLVSGKLVNLLLIELHVPAIQLVCFPSTSYRDYTPISLRTRVCESSGRAQSRSSGSCSDLIVPMRSTSSTCKQGCAFDRASFGKMASFQKISPIIGGISDRSISPFLDVLLLQVICHHRHLSSSRNYVQTSLSAGCCKRC